jgi:rhodanese-related sulfurtransferase
MSSAFASDAIEVTPAEAAGALADGSATLVDVREGYEHDAARVDGALHIELGQLTARAQDIPRDRPVVFLCHSGVRSLMAAEAFRAAGYDARSMAGGIVRWAGEGHPVAPEGAVITH